MPIVNGKYQNPGWINGNRPAVNAQNLNDISDTLERLDSRENGGGKRYASLVVGTSAAGWSAADCDYLCDGTDDQVEIQAAIDALGGAGGEIVILNGTYRLTGPITTTVDYYAVSIALRGCGDTTVLQRAAAGPWGKDSVKYMIGLLDGCSLRDVTIDGGDIPLGTGEKRYEVTAVGGSTIQNCRFRGKQGTSLHCDQLIFTHPVFVAGNRFEGNGTSIYFTKGCWAIVAQNEIYSGKVEGNEAWIILSENMFGTQNNTIVTFDGLMLGSVIAHNTYLRQLSLLHTDTGKEYLGRDCIVTGNVFLPDGAEPVIRLGPGTKENFVTGNLLISSPGGPVSPVQDDGENNIVRFNSGDTGSGGTLPASVLVTLRAAGWSGGRQTVVVQGVSASEGTQLITPSPAAASQSAYYAAGVRATAQGADSLTFAADTVPTADLSVYVVIQEVA